LNWEFCEFTETKEYFVKADWLIEATSPGRRRIFLVKYATNELAKRLIEAECQDCEVSVLVKFGEAYLGAAEPKIIEGAHWGNI
jgi:hypothetical protein